jgi:hypothetical protein
LSADAADSNDVARVQELLRTVGFAGAVAYLESGQVISVGATLVVEAGSAGVATDAAIAAVTRVYDQVKLGSGELREAVVRPADVDPRTT